MRRERIGFTSQSFTTFLHQWINTFFGIPFASSMHVINECECDVFQVCTFFFVTAFFGSIIAPTNHYYGS